VRLSAATGDSVTFVIWPRQSIAIEPGDPRDPGLAERGARRVAAALNYAAAEW
jgi:hypothetical protein